MLGDGNLGNQKLAVTTLNSAIHNKIELILPQLGQLLPSIMQGTHINPALIRTVSYGPFKINIDDGLDVRKASYSNFERTPMKLTCYRVAMRPSTRAWTLPFRDSTSCKSTIESLPALTMTRMCGPCAA